MSTRPKRKLQSTTPEPVMLSLVQDAPLVAPAVAHRAMNPQQLVAHVMYCLTAPMIGFPSWESVVAGHKEEITLHRLAQGMNIWDEQMATEYEAMLYVSSATLAHPPGHDWYCIYLYLFQRYMPEAAAKIRDPDEPPVKLNTNQAEDLQRLRAWLYRQQLQHMAKGKAVGEPEPEKPKAPPQAVQPALFEF